MRTQTLNVKEIKNKLSQKKLIRNEIELIENNEVFAQIPKYNNYFISNYGRLLHQDYRSGKLIIVNPSITKGGYFNYTLSTKSRTYKGKIVHDENGKPKNNRICKCAHQLVALVFIDSQYPDEFTLQDLQVHHKDGNPKNNFYKNLIYLCKNKNGRKDHDLVHSFKKIAVYNPEKEKFYSYSDIELVVKRTELSLLEFLDCIRYADTVDIIDEWTIYFVNGIYVAIQYYQPKKEQKKSKKTE